MLDLKEDLLEEHLQKVEIPIQVFPERTDRDVPRRRPTSLEVRQQRRSRFPEN
jgi:hypothetical protein